MSERNTFNIWLPVIFFVLLAMVIGGLSFFVWNTSRPAAFDMEVSDKPGPERLFIPMKVDVAKELLSTPKVVQAKFKIKVTDRTFTMEGKALYDLFDRIDMRAASMWRELGEYDSALQVTDDFRSLTLGIYNDTDTGEQYVNVPAGLLRAYI